MQSHRILFAGGCHLNGYPISPEVAFPRLIEQDLASAGVAVESKIIAPVKIAHTDKVLTAVRHHEPEVIVLQFGNFESSQGITSPFRSVQTATRSSNWRPAFLKEPSTKTAPNQFDLQWRARNALRLCTHAVLGFPAMDEKRVRREFRRLLGAIQRETQSSVLALSPLPCADSAVAWYRRRLRRTFREECAEAEVTFCDIYDAVARRDEPLDDFCWDFLHLNAEGQRRVAKLVGAELIEVLSRRNVSALDSSTP